MPDYNVIQNPELLQRVTKRLGVLQQHIVPTINEGVQIVVTLDDLAAASAWQGDAVPFSGSMQAIAGTLHPGNGIELINPASTRVAALIEQLWISADTTDGFPALGATLVTFGISSALTATIPPISFPRLGGDFSRSKCTLAGGWSGAGFIADQIAESIWVTVDAAGSPSYRRDFISKPVLLPGQNLMLIMGNTTNAVVAAGMRWREVAI